MSSILVFDIETNGLLDELDKIHTLVIEDFKTGEFFSYADQSGYLPVSDGIKRLSEATFIIGHNIVDFDIPAIRKVNPRFSFNGNVRDTLLISRVIWSNMLDADFRQGERLGQKGKEWIPKKLYGRHSLESWGYRLGDYKGDYNGGWDEWSKEMQDYGEQDVRVTTKLLRKILSKLDEWGYSEEEFFNLKPEPGSDFIQLEHDVAEIITRQVQYGFKFDQEKASKLYAKLVQRRFEIESELKKTIKPWYKALDLVTPTSTRTVKRTDLDIEITQRRFSKKTGKELKPYQGPLRETITKGNPYTKIKLMEFNPNSRLDVADRLMKLKGWQPKEFTNDGKVCVSEDVLKDLPYHEAKLLSEYYTIEKRLGALAKGRQAWLKQVKSDGRIHGQVVTNGAVTGRMTHNRPNMAQVPSCSAPYGADCRELFTVPEGKILIGCDADGLELRDLAGYMARYDNGSYVKTVLEGKKEDKTDMHSQNANVLGSSRDTAKVWFYAFIYGAGDFKLGTILGKPSVAVGKKSRQRFLKSLPALNALTSKVKDKAKGEGWLKGLDGRRLHVRSEHAALNTLLQSAGAIQMKRALVILDKTLIGNGLIPGDDYEFVANVHDEWQIEVKEEYEEDMKKIASTSIKLAGEFYNFKCPLAGSSDSGRSWKDTH